MTHRKEVFVKIYSISDGINLDWKTVNTHVQEMIDKGIVEGNKNDGYKLKKDWRS